MNHIWIETFWPILHMTGLDRQCEYEATTTQFALSNFILKLQTSGWNWNYPLKNSISPPDFPLEKIPLYFEWFFSMNSWHLPCLQHNIFKIWFWLYSKITILQFHPPISRNTPHTPCTSLQYLFNSTGAQMAMSGVV